MPVLKKLAWSAAFHLFVVASMMTVVVKAENVTYTLVPSEDMQIDTGRPDTPYGATVSGLAMWHGPFRHFQSLLKFNLTGLSATTRASSVTLELTTMGSPQGAIISSRTFGGYRMNTTWNEASSTWDSLVNGVSRDDIEAIVDSSFTFVPSSYSTTYAMNSVEHPKLLEDVNAWLAGDVQNNGWLLDSVNSYTGDTFNDLAQMWSREGTVPPRLILETFESNNGGNVGAHGDPYFKDWSGQMYDFMGACDLVLLSNPVFRHIGLDVHVRTTLKKDYSYISATAVQIGTDILEVHSYGVAFLNGVQLDNGKLPQFMSSLNFAITYDNRRKDVHEYLIDISPGRRGRRQVIIRTIGDFGGVRIKKGRHSDFGNSVGLLGKFGTGQHLARDGVQVLEDPYKFGQEWQVQGDEPKLFMNKFRSPQHPHSQCIIPSDPLVVHRRLGETTIMENMAKEACAGISPPEDKKVCIDDVVRTGSIDVAGFYDW